MTEEFVKTLDDKKKTVINNAITIQSPLLNAPSGTLSTTERLPKIKTGLRPEESKISSSFQFIPNSTTALEKSVRELL